MHLSVIKQKLGGVLYDYLHVPRLIPVAIPFFNLHKTSRDFIAAQIMLLFRFLATLLLY